MIVGQTTAFLSSAAAISAAAPSFVSLCSTLAAPASILVSAAPLPTIRQIKENKTVGSLPLLPYSCMAANCVLWTTYGALRHTPAIWAPNGLGLLLALYYIQSFLQNAHPDETAGLKFHVGGVGAVVAAAALAFQCQSYLPLSSVTAIADGVGTAAVLFCIALFASPLSTLKTVMETKSADSIPLPFTIASLLCCFFWSVTGILELHDLNVIVPNALGFLCGLAQVALKLRYSGNINNAATGTTNDPLLASTEVILTQQEMTAQDLTRVVPRAEERTKYSSLLVTP